MLMGAVAVICLLAGLLGYPANLSFYGFETTAPLSQIGLLLIAVMLFKGYSAYQLWFEKDRGIAIARADAIIGVGLCIVSMFAMPFFQDDFKLSFRLELVLIFFYWYRLNKIADAWAAAASSSSVPLPQ
ncbi:hypothetical protein GCM10028822_04020 [Hymenobacter terrigena]